MKILKGSGKTKNEIPEILLALYIQCSYCREFIGVKESNRAGISHGICPSCFKKVMEKYKKHEKRV